ncbi:MAG: hypothetical protein KAI26_05890 [Nanoarchaeota archaeon]|nr:hypothetical protein [Nanoarchaeota archaeon]
MTATILIQLKEAFRLMLRKPGFIAYAVLADMMFIFTITFFSSALYDKILEYVIAASSLTAKSSAQIGSIVASSNTLYSGILSISGVREFAYGIIIISLLLALGTYFIYCFFQGISWHLAGNLAGSRHKYYDFMSSFLKINIIWLVIYALFGIIKLAAGFRKQIASQSYAGDIFDISIIIPILAAIFIYYAGISYSKLFVKGKKGFANLVRTGYKNAGYMVPRYLAIALIIAAIHMLQVIIFKYSIVMSGVLFFAVELPSFTFARIFIIRIMEDKDEKN